MANQLTAAIEVRNWALDAGIGSLTDSGVLKIYNGTQPADPDTAITTQVALVTLTLNADAFALASAGAVAANAITDGTVTVAGTASWFRLFKANGTTPLLDGSVGTEGCDINLDTVALLVDDVIHIAALTVTLPVQLPCQP